MATTVIQLPPAELFDYFEDLIEEERCYGQVFILRGFMEEPWHYATSIEDLAYLLIDQGPSYYVNVRDQIGSRNCLNSWERRQVRDRMRFLGVDPDPWRCLAIGNER